MHLEAEHLTRAARDLFQRGYALSTLGSLSMRLDDGRILFAPESLPKDAMHPADLVAWPATGRDGPRELQLHRAVYLGRASARAAIHCHPVAVLAAGLAGMDWQKPLLPEAVLGVGSVAQLPAWYPGCAPLEDLVAAVIGENAAVVFDRGGVLTAASDPREAFFLVERVEQVARVFVHAREIGRVRHLPAEEVERLRARRP